MINFPVHHKLIGLILPVCIAIVFWYVRGHSSLCYKDYGTGKTLCRHVCPGNQFSLPGMTTCRDLLTCEELDSSTFTAGHLIGQGAVKLVHLSEWEGHQMVLNTLRHDDYSDDFIHGLHMLLGYQGDTRVTQVLGYCGNRYVTEYHQLGSADRLDDILRSTPYQTFNTIQTRLNLCLQYVNILNLLHSGPLGTRVMCDSNDLEKTLSQFLLRSDLQLIVNDLDALPEVNRTEGQMIKCGHRQLFGEFVAPEQLWPYDDVDFDDDYMPSYDEKTDIWKIPDICDYFLGNVSGSDAVRFHLFTIHRRCKEIDPTRRPSAREISDTYNSILLKMKS